MTDKERYFAVVLNIPQGPAQRARLVARLRDMLAERGTYRALQEELAGRYGLDASLGWLWKLTGARPAGARPQGSEQTSELTAAATEAA